MIARSRGRLKRLTIDLAAAVFFTALPALALSAEPTTPAPGSPERKLILDALRAKVGKLPGFEVVFVVKHLKIKDGWGWVHALPQDRGGSNRYEDVSALLRKHGAAWEVTELACAETDNDQCLSNPGYFKLLKKRFPALPSDILPYGGEPKPTPEHAGRNILEWYQTIPEKLLGGQHYVITLRQGTPVSRSTANYEITPLVDIDGGHVKVIDNGTGGGASIQELAFLETNTGNDIIAVNLIANDGLGPVCSLRFYTLDGKWTDVTGRILPTVNLSHFLDERYLAQHKRDLDIQREGITVVYELDSAGGPIFGHIDMERFVYEHGSASLAMELVKNVRYGNVRLTWDKNKNTLRFSGKGYFDGIKRKELLDRIEKR